MNSGSDTQREIKVGGNKTISLKHKCSKHFKMQGLCLKSIFYNHSGLYRCRCALLLWPDTGTTTNYCRLLTSLFLPLCLRLIACLPRLPR